MPMTRTFIETDLAAVKALVDRTIDISYADYYPTAALDYFKEYHCCKNILADAQSGRMLVVEENGAVLATGTLLGTNVRRMFVGPAMQGQGLGLALLISLEDYACRIGLTALDLSASLPARDFYLHRGYSIISEEVISLPDGKELRYYAMGKDTSRLPLFQKKT